jgi:hypothetical protein
LVGAPLIIVASHAQAAVIVDSIHQTLRVRVEATDASGTTVVERVTENTIVSPANLSAFARISHDGFHDHSYASVTSNLTIGEGSIIEADNQLVVEHFLTRTEDLIAANGFAEVITIVELVNTTTSAFFGDGWTWAPGGTGLPNGIVGSGMNVIGPNGELLPVIADEDGRLAPGRYRAEFFTRFSVEPNEGEFWTGLSARSRHFIIFAPTPSASGLLVFAGLAAIRRRR